MSASNRADRSIFWLYLALLFWLPIPLGSNRAWAWSITEIWIFLLSITWLWRYAQHQVTFTPALYQARPILYLLLIWLSYLTIQIIPLPKEWVEFLSPMAARNHDLLAIFGPTKTDVTLSMDPSATFIYLLKSISYTLFFALTLLLVNRKKRLKQLLYLLVISGLFQALYGSFMSLSGMELSFFQEKASYRSVATGTFINRNHYANYLVLSLSAGIGLLISMLGGEKAYSARQRIRSIITLILSKKIRLRVYLSIMVIALVLTHSRMGNTAFFSSLIIAGGIGLLLSKHATRGMVALFVSLIIIDIFIVGAWFGVDQVMQRIEQTVENTHVQQSVINPNNPQDMRHIEFNIERELRDEVNAYSIDLWKDYPITGSGAGSYYTAFSRYQGYDVGAFFDHAHNDYLEFLSESGVIGLSILGLIVLISLAVAIRAQHQRHDPLMRGASFASIMAISAMLIHSSVDFNLQIPANALTFIVMLALAWLSATLKSKRKRQHKHHKIERRHLQDTTP